MSKSPNPELPDDDNPEWTAATFARARPASAVLPGILGEQAAQNLLKPRGRPRAEFPKERINIRLSPDVLAYFKAAGDGWQTRIDQALKQFIDEHPQRS